MAKKSVVDPLVNRAAASGDVAVLQTLLEQGADIEEIHPETGFRPLQTASASGHLEAVRYLIGKDASLNALSNPGHPAPFASCTALIIAAAKGQREIVKELVAAGADVNINVLSEESSTAVSWAAAVGDIETVRFLLEQGATIEGPILYPPVWNADLAMVELLIEEGADVNAKAGNDKPILVRACEKPFRDVNAKAQMKVVGLLLDAGADIEAREDLGATALMAAVRAKNKPLALELLRRGANASATDLGNMTALHTAATDGDLELAEALLKAGADANVKNTFGETPIIRAKENKDKAMIALLT